MSGSAEAEGELSGGAEELGSAEGDASGSGEGEAEAEAPALLPGDGLLYEEADDCAVAEGSR